MSNDEAKEIPDIDFYQVLNLKPDASEKAIRKSYREIARMTHPDKMRGRVDSFINAQNAYRYLNNPTTRMIYDSFGHSGLESYENFPDSYEELERQHRILKESNDDWTITEQEIFDKTTLLISETMKNRVHSQYGLKTHFEFGVDLEPFWNYYVDYKKHGRDDAWQLIDYRQAIMKSSFRIPIASWISGEIEVSTQADMRRNLGTSKVWYTNTMESKDGTYMSNAFNVESNSASIDTEIGTTLFKGAQANHHGIDVVANFSYNKNGLSQPAFSAKMETSKNSHFQFGFDLNDHSYTTAYDTKAGNFSYGFSTSLGDTNASIAPHISYRLNDETTFSASGSFGKSKNNFNTSVNVGFNHKFTGNFTSGLFFNTSIKNADVNFSWLVLNTQISGYSFKLPFFLGTRKSKGSLLLTWGIVLIANAICLLTLSKYKDRLRKRKYTQLDVNFRKFQEKYEEVKTFERNNIAGIQVNSDLEIIDAYIGNKKHVKLIANGVKELFDPPKTPQEFDNCQVVRIKVKLMTMINDSTLEITKNIVKSEGVFNPRRKTGDIALFVHFKYRGLEKKVIQVFYNGDLEIPNLIHDRLVVEINKPKLVIPNDIV